ncbi:unnamed protein product [Closterium sp. NIES-53]
MTTLWVLLHVAAQRDYKLHSLDFSTAFLQGSLHNLRRPVYGLRQAPRKWHDTLRMTLAALGFAPSIAGPSLFLRTDPTLPSFYILVYVNDLVFATADTETLTLVKAGLHKRHTCTDLVGKGQCSDRGAVLGGTVLGGAEPRGAATGGAEPGGAEPGGALPGGTTPGSAAGAGGSSATEGVAIAGPGGARTVSTGAAGPASSTGAGAAEGVGTETTAGGPAGGTPGAGGGSGAAGGAAGEGAPTGGTGAVPAVSGVAARPRPYFVPLLEQVLGSPPSTGLPPSLACPQPVQSQLQLQPTSPLPAPSPYTGARRCGLWRPCRGHGGHPRGRGRRGGRRGLGGGRGPHGGPKRVLRYLCSTSGMGLVLGGRSPVVLTGHADASWADDQATQRSSQGYTFSLGSGSVSWRATRSSSVLGSSCEAEIYAGAMAAQELRWLTYMLTDLGEPPRSPPVLYVDNKAMLALCREQRLEHRTKHIALRYFLARELQQRGQLRLAYVASEANTADVFTKALAPCDHQRFCTQLGLVPVLPHLLTS